MKEMRLLLFTCVLLSIFSCAAKPLPSSEWASTPSQGNSGIYFYQANTGIVGSLYKISLYIDGEKLGEIGTGQWLYFELPAGEHSYHTGGGQVLGSNRKVIFEEGNNYFFRAFMMNGFANVYLVHNESEIKTAYEQIKSGKKKYGLSVVDEEPEASKIRPKGGRR